MNDELAGRLYNYKFTSAMNYIENESKNTKELVEALSETFGNPGIFDGHLNIIIYNALENIGLKFED